MDDFFRAVFACHDLARQESLQAVELHSESTVVVQGSLAAASPYQLKTWSMILGFISRGSMPLILHHVLDNYEALGGEFVVLCCVVGADAVVVVVVR